MSMPVRIVIRRREQVENADETILLQGRRFAGQYGLNAPRRILHPFGAKPRFAEPGVFFSLSHSGNYWVCALANAELGVDIQRFQPCRGDLIAGRFFHPDEVSWIKDRGEEGFFAVWTAKESYVKFTGEGITDDFAAFSVVNDEGKIDTCGHGVLRHIPFAENYSLCLCTPEKAEVEIVGPELSGE